MSLTYSLRLLCLCCASFFVIHFALTLIARLVTGPATRLAGLLKPPSAARLLLGLRISPVLLAAVAVFAFCIPSYLWLEPEAAGEKIGAACVVSALLGAAIVILGLWRAAKSQAATVRYLRRGERSGRNISVPGEPSPVLLLAEKRPVLAMAGVFHPRLVISRRVMRALTGEQIEAALRHEQAHRASRDNLKRFLLLLAPDPLPFVRSFAGLERSWDKFTEWAADDRATMGDPQRALSLASALVRVAKMGGKPRLSYLFSSLLGDNQELSERVDRLLRPASQVGQPRDPLLPFISGAGAVVAGLIAIVACWPGTLSLVHEALEQLVH